MNAETAVAVVEGAQAPAGHYLATSLPSLVAALVPSAEELCFTEAQLHDSRMDHVRLVYRPTQHL